MRGLLALIALVAAPVLAADDLTPAQQRMRACNTQAKQKGLEARERSRFITDCLNGRKGRRPLTPIQAKNEACTKEADHRGLDGAARRGFMGECTKPDHIKEETADRTRLKNCTRRADGRKLEGEDRRKFIDGCLDGATVVDG
jgi:psiF repeat